MADKRFKYCPDCLLEHLPTENFCKNCGIELKWFDSSEYDEEKLRLYDGEEDE